MQQVLVQLLSSIKSMPLDSLIQTIHQVVKQPSLSQVITILSDLYIDVINIYIIFLGRPTRYSN
jgi:hypothetical protein